MKEKFSFFGPATLAYAVFYAFCMFQNDAGIAFLFFIIATQAYLCVALRQLDMKLKKGSAFYLTAMLLLAVSTFCTDDAGIIIFNKTGIFLLAISLLLKNFYQTNEWGLGKYLQSILLSGVGCLEELERPFTDTAEHMKKGGKDGKNLGYVLLGLVISFPVLAVVIGLLADADVFFRQIAYDVVDVINAESIVWVMSRILLVFLFTYILIARLCRHSLSESVTDHRRTGACDHSDRPAHPGLPAVLGDPDLWFIPRADAAAAGIYLCGICKGRFLPAAGSQHHQPGSGIVGYELFQREQSIKGYPDADEPVYFCNDRLQRDAYADVHSEL